MTYLLPILGLGILMAVHESGHFLLAKLFGMRVLRFSLGFGPVIWSHKPANSETTYQLAALPFLAYVQIAGMNPHEEISPEDKGSYANASWTGRVLTILAGPLANYLFAVLVFFFLMLSVGRLDPDGLHVGQVDPQGAAAAAHIQPNDEVRAIEGQPVADWPQMKTAIQARRGMPTKVLLQRGTEQITVSVTPSPAEGLIGIRAKDVRRSVSVVEAGRDALIEPPKIAAAMVVGLAKLATGREKAELRGPVGIVAEAHQQIEKGWENFVDFYVILSIYICVFNLIPFPALDGGRLAFLIYEFVARRRPDARVEARVHMVGLLALLSVFVPLFFFEIWQKIASLFGKG